MEMPTHVSRFLPVDTCIYKHTYLHMCVCSFRVITSIHAEMNVRISTKTDKKLTNICI